MMADRAPGHPEKVRLLFDTKAATWSAKYAPGGRLVDRLTRFADAVGFHIAAEGTVLDLGCGTGELSRHLGAVGLRVTGCDISPQMLEQAATGDDGRVVDWVCLDPEWRMLPFEPDSFDAVVAASVLEYVDSPAAVLAECARVLRPGGVMLCTVPDLAHPVRWLEWLAGLAGRIPVMRALASDWPRAERYLTYLQISRQRHPAGWWHNVAAQAGLLTGDRPPDAAAPSPLRLFTFQRPTK